MPQCGITETALFHFELEYLFLSGLTFYIEATPPAEKDPVTFNHQFKNSEMRLWL